MRRLFVLLLLLSLALGAGCGDKEDDNKQPQHSPKSRLKAPKSKLAP
jgi:hypothetical protein